MRWERGSESLDIKSLPNKIKPSICDGVGRDILNQKNLVSLAPKISETETWLNQLGW